MTEVRGRTPPLVWTVDRQLPGRETDRMSDLTTVIQYADFQTHWTSTVSPPPPPILLPASPPKSIFRKMEYWTLLPPLLLRGAATVQKEKNANIWRALEGRGGFLLEKKVGNESYLGKLNYSWTEFSWHARHAKYWEYVVLQGQRKHSVVKWDKKQQDRFMFFW